MIEKIKISLWDILAFFLSGLLLALFIAIHMIVYGGISFSEIIEGIIRLPASVSLFIIPVVLMIAGLLLEPGANYFDKCFTNLFWFKIFPQKTKHIDEEKLLERIIKEKYLDGLSNEITNPYHFCKEYVETKQLSTTFMVFLSRYGFYRNVSFLCVVGSIISGTHWSSWLSLIPITVWILLAGIFKHRAEDFYSYLAPNVYRCFLIDRAFSNDS